MSDSSAISLQEQAGSVLKQMKQYSAKEASSIDQLEELLQQMNNQLSGLSELLKQNAAMEEAITDLTSELEEATTGILKRGHLYKWREQTISFASKWGLRYLTLQGSVLNYFNDEKDRHPRKTIDLKHCFILDEGLTRNKQYHIFSICSTAVNEENRGPHSGALLRLSSDNLAEATQWIQMLEKACGFSNVDESTREPLVSRSPFSDDMTTNPVLTRVKSSEAILNNVTAMIKSSPRHRSQTALDTLSSSPTKKKTKKKSAAVQHQNIINKLKKKVHVTSFPASKNIHLSSKYSPLSSSATRQNYRGFFNLGVIIFMISHFRLILDNLIHHGFRMSALFDMSSHASEGDAMDISQLVLVLASWAVPVALTYFVEKLAQHFPLSNRLVMIIQGVLSLTNIVGCALWVWHSNSHSALSMLYLLQSVIIWMKMISYAHCNRDLRIAHQVNKNGKVPVTSENVHSEIQDLEGPITMYPHNLNILNLMYFCVAPTLCYQLNYPRSVKLRWTVVFTLVVRLVVTLAVILIVVEQHMKPALEAAMEPMNNFDFLAVLFRFLQLTIPSTYVWLLGFYLFFHLWLNLLAELTRFGDREFYLDWWNARTIDEYWRTWNLPVHHWMIRHLYYPSIRLGISKKFAVYIAFFFSAVMHEFIISLPFHRISFHAFLGMILQAPLVPITRKLNALFNNHSIGNIFFWLSFCIIGQPIGIIMYYYESWNFTACASQDM